MQHKWLQGLWLHSYVLVTKINDGKSFYRVDHSSNLMAGPREQKFFWDSLYGSYCLTRSYQVWHGNPSREELTTLLAHEHSFLSPFMLAHTIWCTDSTFCKVKHHGDGKTMRTCWPCFIQQVLMGLCRIRTAPCWGNGHPSSYLYISQLNFDFDSIGLIQYLLSSFWKSLQTGHTVGPL